MRHQRWMIVAALTVAALGGCQRYGGSNPSEHFYARKNLVNAPFAKLVAEGATEVTWTADKTGELTVYDRNEERVILVLYMRPGWTATLKPDASEVILARPEVTATAVKATAGNVHQFYFEQQFDPG